MKLLFDQNLSIKLVTRLNDLFPGSSQLRQLSLDRANDRVVWDYAKSHDFVLVTQDSDFADLSTLLGFPPKVIWLRCGNQTTEFIEALLRHHADEIAAFHVDLQASCLEVI